MKTIGITGGIGSGKSTVTDFLRQKGYPVIDADEAAREIVKPGSRVLMELADEFGEGILLPDGSLNRKELAAQAFSCKKKKIALDRITHGAILASIKGNIEQLKCQGNTTLVFVDAALMVETGLHQFMDEIWLITADEKIRINRVMTRDMVAKNHVMERMKFQLSDEEKSEYASRVIDNSKTKNELYRELERILEAYEAV